VVFVSFVIFVLGPWPVLSMQAPLILTKLDPRTSILG
jgi:hypothetical protein